MFLFDKPDKEHTRNEAYHLYLHLVSIVINCLRIIRESNTCFAILCPKIPVEQFLIELFSEYFYRESVYQVFPWRKRFSIFRTLANPLLLYQELSWRFNRGVFS